MHIFKCDWKFFFFIINEVLRICPHYFITKEHTVINVSMKCLVKTIFLCYLAQKVVVKVKSPDTWILNSFIITRHKLYYFIKENIRVGGVLAKKQMQVPVPHEIFLSKK